MSDPTTETPEATAPQQGDPAADKPLGENGEKALKAERERAAKAEKAAGELQKQLDAINAANLSDLEKAQKAAKDAEALANGAMAEALRYRIAAEKGITENVDLILTATDEDTMRKQADLWGSRNQSDTTSPGPRPDLTQGAKGTPAGGSSPEQDFATFIGRQIAGT